MPDTVWEGETVALDACTHLFFRCYDAPMTSTLLQALADEKARQVSKRTVNFGLRLDDETHDMLVKVSTREGVPINGLIVAVLRRALATAERAG